MPAFFYITFIICGLLGVLSNNNNAQEQEEFIEEDYSTTPEAFPIAITVDNDKLYGVNWHKYIPHNWLSKQKEATETPIFEDGSCGVWDEQNQGYMLPQMSYHKMQIGCVHEFVNRIFQPKCGNANYEFMRECAMIHFYQGKNYEESIIAKGNKHEKVRALILIDGCFFCDLAKFNKTETDHSTLMEPFVEVNVKITYKQPAGGSIFSNCYEEIITAFKYQFKLVIDKMSGNPGELIDTFTVVNQLFRPECSAVFHTEDPPEKYEELKIFIEHNCTQSGQMQSINVDMEDLEPKQFKGNVAEIRWMKFDLSQESVGLWQQQMNGTGSVVVEEVTKLKWSSNKD